VCHASANTEGGHTQRTSEGGSCQQLPDTHAQSLRPQRFSDARLDERRELTEWISEPVPAYPSLVQR
jgi:hypothetical protein